MKTQLITVDGTVIEDLSNCKYKVELDNGNEIVAYIAGKLRKNNIRIIVGDRVTLELSPYDLYNGRITYRKKVEYNEDK
jgi:translation initiation factor IF-1